MSKKKAKFFFFVGMCFLMYLLIFFPDKGVEYTLTHVLIDSLKSILISFVIVYVSEWMWRIIDSKVMDSE